MIKITDLFSILKPGWVAMDSDGYWIWFEKRPKLVKSYWVVLSNPNDSEDKMIYWFDDIKDKPKDIPDEDVEVSFNWSTKGNRVTISDSDFTEAFKDIEPVKDWRKSLRKVA